MPPKIPEVRTGVPSKRNLIYWFRLNEESGCAQHSRYIGLHWPNALKEEILLAFPTRLFRKQNASRHLWLRPNFTGILGFIRRTC